MPDVTELIEVIKNRQLDKIRSLAADLPPSEIANALTAVESMGDRALAFRCLPRELATDAFEYLALNKQKELLETLANREVSDVLNEMADDDRTRLFEELPANAAKKLLELLSDDERSRAVQLLGYPAGSVGRLMTPHYIAVLPSWSVSEVLDDIRTRGRDSETLTMVYVVNDSGHLIDDIRMRSFLLSPLDTRVAELMNNRFVALTAHDTQEDAVAVFRHADLPALPVTDTEGILLGVVTSDDMLDVAEQEATEDIQKFGGSEALDLPYVDTPLITLIQKRAGWLIILFLGEMLTASAMGYFEHEIAQAVVLALFIPLIISSGENSGSQAATLVIRAMALQELGPKNWWYVMRREIVAGLSLGVILGMIGFVRVSLWHYLGFFDYSEHWLLVALTIMLSLIAIVLWGTLSGSLIPLIMRRLGLDPATSSAPLVATLVDVTGIVIYFSIALFILKGTLL